MSQAQNLKIGRFTVIKALGRGSQGAVYLAKDPDLDRLVALKLMGEIPGQAPNDGEGWAQARNLAQLRHPNIIALHELGRFHTFVYLVFEYLEGKPLRDELRAGGALALPHAYSTILQITDAMAYAHAKGILHLDLNPNNIMRDEAGKPRIMDFDLSRRVGVQSESKLITGTLPYMAPEHFRTRVLDRRTDVYALGQILYELLSGELAVPLGEDIDMIGRICNQDADLAPLQRADPQGHFVAVVQQATRKDVAQRYADAGALREALVRAWENSQGTAAHPQAAHHGTVAFVLKRIERRGDFPAVSKTLAEINQLTSADNQSPVSRLTAVILRDYALTSRLLKLANSPLYARTGGKVKTVSEAVNLLGIEQVRLTCNGLACFGHFAGRKQDLRLREESIAAFLAGLVARHLCAETKLRQTEEAFLAGMLYNLGKMLVLFYFSEDYEEIEQLIGAGATPDEAARTIMGISLADVGRAVGEVWGLPAAVNQCMVEPSVSDEYDSLRTIVRFANALVARDARQDPTGAHIEQAGAALPADSSMTAERARALLEAALEKFKTFAPALEVDLSSTACIQRLQHWVDTVAHHLAHATASPA